MLIGAFRKCWSGNGVPSKVPSIKLKSYRISPREIGKIIFNFPGVSRVNILVCHKLYLNRSYDVLCSCDVFQVGTLFSFKQLETVTTTVIMVQKVTNAGRKRIKDREL